MTRILDTIFGIIDVFVSSLVVILSCLILSLIIIIKVPFTKKKKVDEEKKVLFLLMESVDRLKKKGVYEQIFNRDLEGYFKEVYTIHLFAPKNQTLKPKERHIIIEYGPTFRTNKFRALSYILTELRFLVNAYKLIKKEKISVIRAQDPFINGINGIILARLSGIPIAVNLVTNYELIYKNTKQTAIPFLRSRKIERLLEKITYNKVDMVLPASDSIIKSIERIGAKPRCTDITRAGGMSEKEFELAKTIDNKQKFKIKNKSIVAYVGRLSAEKYTEDVIKCASEVLKQRNDVIFILAGDGPLKNDLESLAKKLNIEANVKLIGFINNEDAFRLISSSDVLVSPLTGNSIREAALMKKPVVAYDTDWQPEIIKDKKTGLLVPLRDYNKMTQGVLEILSKPEYGKKLGENLNKFFIEQQSPKKIIEKEREIYDKILSSMQE